MTCEMEINSQGEVVNHKIFPSVIRSTERMTYVAINKILESDDEAMKERYHDLVRCSVIWLNSTRFSYGCGISGAPSNLMITKPR